MGAQERLGGVSEPNLLSQIFFRQVEKTVGGLVTGMTMSSSSSSSSPSSSSLGGSDSSAVISESPQTTIAMGHHDDAAAAAAADDDEMLKNYISTHPDLVDLSGANNNVNGTDFFASDDEFLCYSGHFADNGGGVGHHLTNSSGLSLSLSSSPSSSSSSSHSLSPTSFVLTEIIRIFQTDNNRTTNSTSATSLTSATTPGVWGSQQQQHQLYCNRSWDGLLCWPEIPEKHSVTVPCFAILNRIAYDTSRTVTRACEEGGIWENTTDYSNCVALTAAPETNDDWILEITTWVYFFGYCLSLSTLILAMSIFIVFKELRCLRNTIHTNLMLTYISADALWLITSIQSHIVSNGHASCVTFILLHYFHLTNFFWMFVEGLYLYVLVVQTFTAENIKLRTYLFIGWGLPLLVVIGWSIAKWITQAGAGVDIQVNKIMTDPDFNPPACVFLTVNPYDWIYKSPAILVLAANSLFLLQIMWVLITKLRSATNPETQQSRKAAKALVVLMPLLGITYVLVLTGSKQTPIYEHIRALLISTQGFLVALLYCFLNGEVRQAVCHRWNRISNGQGFERFCRFCCCGFCGNCSRRGQMHHHRDWSLPRSRTESIRLYNCPPSTNCHNNQHTYFSQNRGESLASDMTTMTMTQTNSLHFTAASGLHGNNGGQYHLRPPFMLNANGSGSGNCFEPILLSPTLTVSTNLSTLATTTPTPTSMYGHSTSSGLIPREFGGGGPDPVQQQQEEQEDDDEEEEEGDDLEDVDFIDSFEGQQEHYGI